WLPQRQQRFETLLARLTASANLPHSWVEDPEWKRFLSEFVPSARPFSRKTLTNRLIPSALSVLRAESRAKVVGRVVTLHTDGWSASNFHHFQGFSITAERQSLPVSLKDTTAERKTAELLLVHIRAVIREVTNNTSASWRARLIAFVTDNSGESLSARNTIAVEFPGILCFPCYTHQ
ncbi:uncharacterized protein PHACADRAFT_46940, partial [Phanerochaete carnosa HHB-10118-sp]